VSGSRIETEGLGAWRAVFIVGNCKAELWEEQEQYGDLLFTSVEESYYALTGKVLEFFEHASTVNAKFTMKTDDDTFVFVDRMLSELQVTLLLQS
jgi:DNA-binding ferritin-like protein (Dps family)